MSPRLIEFVHHSLCVQDYILDLSIYCLCVLFIVFSLNRGYCNEDVNQRKRRCQQMRTLNIKEFIAELNLQDSETQRVSCPLCGGYKTFTVTRQGGQVLYNCYKASCNAKGNAGVRRSMSHIRNVLQPKDSSIDPAPKTFELPTALTLPSTNGSCTHYMEDMNVQPAIDDKYAYVLYDIKEHRCVFLITNDNKNVIGAVGRALRKGVVPKWKRYDKRKDLMFICGPKQGTAVVVEDCASACTVYAAGYTGVALLGTTLSAGHVYQLRGSFSKVIIALDSDASKKSIQMKKMLDAHVPTEVMFLNDDLKYFTPECVKSLISK